MGMETYILQMHIRTRGIDIYFSSKKIGAQAVHSIGKERLKKYYFEVED